MAFMKESSTCAIQPSAVLTGLGLSGLAEETIPLVIVLFGWGSASIDASLHQIEKISFGRVVLTTPGSYPGLMLINLLAAVP